MRENITVVFVQWFSILALRRRKTEIVEIEIRFLKNRVIG